jgi:CheY-like chemotaxis protein
MTTSGRHEPGLKGAVGLASSQRPDVVLMDIHTPVLDGIEATLQITRDPRLASPPE